MFLMIMMDLKRIPKDVCHQNRTGQDAIKNTYPIDERGSKMVRKSVFDCHLSPVGRQIAIENSVFNYFDLRSSIG